MDLELPVIYLLSTHLSADELHELEEQIQTLTYDANEAEVLLGKISKNERALFELRRLKIKTEEVPSPLLTVSPKAKRRKLAGSHTSFDDTDSSEDDGQGFAFSTQDQSATHQGGTTSDTSVRKDHNASGATVKVVKLAWFMDSVASGRTLPMDSYIIYEGYKVTDTTTKPPVKPPPKAEDILRRARADAGHSQGHTHFHGSSRRSRAAPNPPPIKPPALIKQTTSEHDVGDRLPPIPEFLHTTYSCQRPTPVNSPNDQFIEELKKIRTARLLTGDKIGVRAYSTSIATVAAYPYSLQSAPEVARLPGCGNKIAVLFQEFKDTGEIKEAKDAESDARLSILKLFYEIWGVAETTAREFYNKGWRDLDDIVEYGWNSLSRVQQIGVKYYDEFQLKIPRVEVESIASTILAHANKIRAGFQMVIVGGYRRGKELSGDVDVVLSHPDESATQGFIENIVLSLEKDKFITHTLTLSTKNTERGQTPVSWKGNERRGSGFDTLDKALVVWQDPKWALKEGETKSTNPHRRVDIIISPWKTVGCAVLGWSSGTTFQRDLRRYCKKERSLKFDSSGIRSRVDGAWVDLEDSGQGKAPDMLTAERRVFAGLELEYRPPEERCTG